MALRASRETDHGGGRRISTLDVRNPPPWISVIHVEAARLPVRKAEKAAREEQWYPSQAEGTVWEPRVGTVYDSEEIDVGLG